MITQKDIQNLKEIFMTKDEFHEFRLEMTERFSDLYSAIDTFLKRDITYEQEVAVMNYRMTRSEKWMRQAGDKIGLKFET